MRDIERKSEIINNSIDLISKDSDYSMEFIYGSWETDFLRFYHSQVNYNISKSYISLTGTIEKDKRKFSFTLANPREEDIYTAVASAKKIIDKLPQDPDFVSFEDNKDEAVYENFDNSIEKIPLDEKIAILTPVSDMAKKHDFDIYGTFITLNIDNRIINSNGLDKRFFQSPVMMDVKAVSNKNMASVIDSYGGNDLSRFDLNEFITRMEYKIKKARLEIIDVESGEYTAILAPHAVSEFLNYMISAGVSAESLDAKTSFLENRIGEQVFNKNITIASMPRHPELIFYPYNRDGHIANDLTIFDKGVFKNFITDHYYSNKLKIPKNGSVGASAMYLEAGDTSLDRMIADVKRGLYISNLHYMNFINRKETSVTGLTRDGTFLIEDGKIVKLVNNLRYTEKLTDIFNNITKLENKQYSIPSSGNYDDFKLTSALVPHVITSKFQISSSTKTV